MDKTETLVAIMPVSSTDEQELSRQVTDIEFRAGAITINSEEDYQNAALFGSMLKQRAAEVKEFWKPMKDSAHRAHAEICAKEKAMLQPLANAEKILKQTVGAYVAEQEKKRREVEEAARRAAEAERERKLQEAAALESAGDHAGADAAMAEAVVMDEAVSYSVPQAAKPKAAGVSASKDWEITEIDPGLVPLTFAGVEIRPVDKAAIMRLIRASKGKIEIPGIAYHEVAKMSFRR